MNKRSNLLYVVQSSATDCTLDEEDSDETTMAEPSPEQAADYAASMLGGLRVMVARAKLPLLADLIAVAEEEARFHCHG